MLATESAIPSTSQVTNVSQTVPSKTSYKIFFIFIYCDSKHISLFVCFIPTDITGLPPLPVFSDSFNLPIMPHFQIEPTDNDILTFNSCSNNTFNNFNSNDICDPDDVSNNFNNESTINASKSNLLNDSSSGGLVWSGTGSNSQSVNKLPFLTPSTYVSSVFHNSTSKTPINRKRKLSFPNTDKKNSDEKHSSKKKKT